MKSLNSILLLFVFAATFFSCKEEQKAAASTTAAPQTDCISDRIKKLSAQKYPAKVYQYKYNNNKVYYIPAYMPDAFSELLDVNCNVICHPEGGITGKGDGQCTDFFSARTDEKLLWQKEDK
jgi:hypothetical protein